MIAKQILISPMSINDIENILLIENLCFSIPWNYDSFYNEILTNKFAFYHTIKVNNNIVGYSGLWKVLDEGHITNIAIHPDYRNHGLASMLLENMLDFCKCNNISSLTLEVRKSNIPAQNLYKKYGFIESGVRKGYYADTKEDAIIMWKKDI